MGLEVWLGSVPSVVKWIFAPGVEELSVTATLSENVPDDGVMTGVAAEEGYSEQSEESPVGAMEGLPEYHVGLAIPQNRSEYSVEAVFATI